MMYSFAIWDSGTSTVMPSLRFALPQTLTLPLLTAKAREGHEIPACSCRQLLLRVSRDLKSLQDS